jgi:hypothetical protein
MGGRAEKLGGEVVQRTGTDSPVLTTKSQALASPSGTGRVFQLKREDYVNGYCAGYREGFRKGLLDGLKELVGAKVLDLYAAQNIRQHYSNDQAIQLEFVQNYREDYEPEASSEEHYEAGNLVGYGAGFDRGYELALSEYGYDRQYSAIPGGNKSVAWQDNNGTCVYCNAHPIEDVDHIESLKNHWSSRGATMDKQTRSDEANHTNNLVGSCAACNRSKGSKKLGNEWWPAAWNNNWWPFGPNRVVNGNSPPPYW